MLVLAAVPDIQHHQLRRAVAARFAVVHAGSWDAVLHTIRSRPVEIVVLDPLLSGEARSQEIERLRLLFPSLPLILYTSLTPELAGVLLTLGQCGIRHVVFSRFDDHPERLRQVIADEEMHAASRRMLGQLAEALAPLPQELRWVLEEALRTPGEVQTIQQVAARARVGSPAPACPARATFSPRRACSTPTACCRTRGSPSRTWRSGSDTPRPGPCSSTPAPILVSRPE